jgi:hypothetical protein
MIGEDLAHSSMETMWGGPMRSCPNLGKRVGRAIRTVRYKYAVYAPGLNGGAVASSDYYVDDFCMISTQIPRIA